MRVLGGAGGGSTNAARRDLGVPCRGAAARTAGAAVVQLAVRLLALGLREEVQDHSYTKYNEIFIVILMPSVAALDRVLSSSARWDEMSMSDYRHKVGTSH
jgi:hypothetical protein